MQTPLEMSFGDVQPSEEIRALIEERAARLEKFCDRITSCHVRVQAGHRHHRVGNLYEVTLEVRVPGDELVVHQRQDDAAEHMHPMVAIRAAFAAMERRLSAWKAKMGGEVKAHDGPLQGRVAEIDHGQGFGQIRTTDHRLVYFHRNSVLGAGFDALAEGDPVELAVDVEESPRGPQASTVRPIGPMQYDPG